jgi:mRNA interferase YafQ
MPRTIEWGKKFTRDYRREQSGVYAKKLDDMLAEVLVPLVEDKPLDRRYCDHDLDFDWKGYRECHIRGDFLLIYRKLEPNTLQLVRLGSHSQLGLK